MKLRLEISDFDFPHPDLVRGSLRAHTNLSLHEPLGRIARSPAHLVGSSQDEASGCTAGDASDPPPDAPTKGNRRHHHNTTTTTTNNNNNNNKPTPTKPT